MWYLLMGLGYTAIRLEVVKHPYMGAYSDLSSSMLWLLAVTEVALKTLAFPLVAFADAVNYVSSWNDGIPK